MDRVFSQHKTGVCNSDAARSSCMILTEMMILLIVRAMMTGGWEGVAVRLPGVFDIDVMITIDRV
jgi:hypothetical protein